MVDILYVDVSSVGDEMYSQLYALADAARRTRTERYIRFEDKVRCVAAGALLRYAVKRSLGVDTFEIVTDVNGKPCIPEAHSFHFNISHSGKWVVIAYGDTPVGIDVEKIDPNAAIENIANRFFASDERAYVLDSEDNRRKRFFGIWTAKESYIKFLGKGLQMALDSFSVLSTQNVRFSPIDIDPEYSMTLCAAESAGFTKQLTVEQLTDSQCQGSAPNR